MSAPNCRCLTLPFPLPMRTQGQEPLKFKCHCLTGEPSCFKQVGVGGQACDCIAIRNRSLTELSRSPIIFTTLCTRPSSAQLHGAIQKAYECAIEDLHSQGKAHPCLPIKLLTDLPGYKYACSSPLAFTHPSRPSFFIQPPQRISASPSRP